MKKSSEIRQLSFSARHGILKVLLKKKQLEKFSLYRLPAKMKSYLPPP